LSKRNSPGLEAKDIDVSLDGNVLTLRGERKQKKEKKEESFHRVERSYGSLSRSIRLPAEGDHNQIKAIYKRGVLKINLPEIREESGQKIEVRGQQTASEISLERLKLGKKGMRPLQGLSQPPVIEHYQQYFSLFLSKTSARVGCRCIKINAVSLLHNILLAVIDEFMPPFQNKYELFTLVLKHDLLIKSRLKNKGLHVLAGFVKGDGLIGIPIKGVF